MSWAEYVGIRSVNSASLSRAGLGIDIDIVSDLASVETLWRGFQQDASHTPFQTFEWLSAWGRTIGAATSAVPAIVTLRRHGKVAAIIPLAFQDRGLVREVTFLGNTLCDYNAPLLAPGFAKLLPPRLFLAAWEEVKQRFRNQYRYNLLRLEKRRRRL
jgi:CelD/BcsL family acetyltransferase involved in cellulose biosynthesis